MQTPKRTVKVRIGGKLTVRKRPAKYHYMVGAGLGKRTAR
jgi:hypothetical protein